MGDILADRGTWRQMETAVNQVRGTITVVGFDFLHSEISKSWFNKQSRIRANLIGLLGKIRENL